MDNDYLREVFKETNAHIRATEQKSLILTGAFVGFYLNGFIYVLKGQGISASNAVDPLVIAAFHLLLLFVGSVVYVMQLWYRAWKEHYLQVCLDIRKHFEPTPNSESVFPFWLRDVVATGGRFSFDNLIMYVTLLVNLGVLFLIAQDTQDLLKASAAATFVIGAIFLAYLTLVSVIHKKMRNPLFLAA